MKNPLESLHMTLVSGFLLLVIVALTLSSHQLSEPIYWLGVLKLLHEWTGIIWIGLLYYFNFVQIPSMKKIPDDQKPAITKVIAPMALFFFRWAAMATFILGLILAYSKGYLHEAYTLQSGYRAIGIGMWLATIMFAFVWLIIWPNQKRALGIVQVDAETKKASGRRAMLFSRINAMLSLPMLYSMVAQSNMISNSVVTPVINSVAP